MSETIAVIGLGAMGLALATRLHGAGHAVTGCDLRAESRDAFAAIGGSATHDAKAAVQGASVVILFVVNADQVDAILFDGGVLEATAPETTIVSMVTSPPARAAATAARVEATQRAYLDAPVSGGVPGIENGTLTIMASGPDRSFDRVAPLLRSIGSNTFRVGPEAGQGSAMKTVNQLLAGVHIAAAAEALALAEKAGIDAALALEILTSGAASSWMLANRGPRMIEPGDTVASAVDIFVKDLGIVLDAGTKSRLGLPLSAAAHQQFLNASGMGLGATDDSQVVEVYRAMSKRSTTSDT
ncbi:MAG: NAD(P)-dependent oxidoreductase [Pseudomonadota bacterium]